MAERKSPLTQYGRIMRLWSILGFIGFFFSFGTAVLLHDLTVAFGSFLWLGVGIFSWLEMKDARR